MNLNIFQKGLWIAAGLAILLYVVTLLVTDKRADFSPIDQSTFQMDFELTDHTGLVRTERDFAGRWVIVFFGFANCPDVCPTTLADVSNVIRKIGGKASKIQPLFISIDPERDTPEELASYLPNFDERIIGLTGTSEQIEKTARSFYIFHEKTAEASAPDGYTMSHSSQLFFFQPIG